MSYPNPPQNHQAGWYFIEMFALGAVLHGFDVMGTSGFGSAFGWWVGGGIVAIVGWNWGRFKALLGPRFEETEKKVVTDFRCWVITALILFVLPNLARYIEATMMVYGRINDPPSTVLDLTDAKRWRLLKEIATGTSGNNCHALIVAANEERSRDLENDMLTIFHFAWGAGMEGNNGPLPKGVTFSLFGDSGPLLQCADYAVKVLQGYTDRIHLVVRTNVETDALKMCDNKCIAISINERD